MSEITIKENKLRDKEYQILTTFTDVESAVSAEVLSEVTGPAASAFTDVTYNITTLQFVTNINAFEFGFIPLNDVLTYEE